VLFERLGLKPTKKTSTGWSTDVSVLTRLADEHELPRQLLEYRQLAKLLSTYVEALPRLVNPATGCLHTSFNQAVAATGRLSSTDPNLQNIPIRTERGRRIREAFVPRVEGWTILAADYSQIELRLMAHFAGEDALIGAFRNGEDIHRRTAAIVHGVGLDEIGDEQRRSAKAINFGILYGMGARALGQQIGVKTREAQAFIDDYFERLPRVREWIDATVERAREEGEVRTLYGRRRKLPELQSKDPRQKAFGERIAVNTPIQGTAADLIKLAMIRLDRRIRETELPVRMLLQVHDELVFEVEDGRRDEVAEVVRTEMEGVADLAVPLKIDWGFGPNWAEAH
jgi:DNA polymerase-1